MTEEKIELDIIPQKPVEYIGWLETSLPKSVMSKLQSYIEVSKKNPTNVNDELAGNISKSLKLEDKDRWFSKTVLNPLMMEFFDSFPQYAKQIKVITEAAPLVLEKFWVNFQKENEFNPIHNHGGIFSFVVWVKIPTDWREQHALPFSANSNVPCTSDFQFQYTTMLGDHGHHNYFLDKSSEGCMLFFPAKLTHTVYPFYNCDKERISISGNIKFDISENTMKHFRFQMKGKND